MIDLERIYGQAGKELRAMLASIDLRTFDGGKADAIRSETRRLVAALNLAVKKWTETEIAKAYKAGGRRAKVALETLGKKPRRTAMAGDLIIRDKVLETLIGANTSIRHTVDEYLDAALAGAHIARSARVQEFDKRKMLERFGELADEAVATEITRRELMSDILDYLIDRIDEEGLIAVRYSDGSVKYWDARKYAKLVARTEMARSSVAGKLDACRQYDNDLVQVSDEPTDCEDCAEVIGNIYSLSGEDPDYPPLDFEVPLHPNCRHDLNPTSREAMAARGVFG